MVTKFEIQVDQDSSKKNKDLGRSWMSNFEVTIRTPNVPSRVRIISYVCFIRKHVRLVFICDKRNHVRLFSIHAITRVKIVLQHRLLNFIAITKNSFIMTA